MFMRVLLTGGSGDLGVMLSEALAKQGDEPLVIDVAPPHASVRNAWHASILDLAAVAAAVETADCVIHLAAWHGIHESRQTKNAGDFHDLNVTGTFNMLDAAAHAGVKKFIFMSSTSVSDRFGVYGHSKVLAEEMARAYAHRHDMDVVILRPRAFIPSWNTAAYTNFAEWAAWYAKGAVHIGDVMRATLCALDYLNRNPGFTPKAPAFTIDGAYDYTAEDLENWDKDGAGSTFRKYYAEYETLMQKHGLDPTRPPKVLDMAETRAALGYVPQYSLRNMLEELRRYDAGLALKQAGG
jgi:nucleoside-diphosphate-sugar epimerase